MKITDIKIYQNISDSEVLKIACQKNKIDLSRVKEWHIIKKSVDARRKNDVHFNYSIEIILDTDKVTAKKNLLLVENKKQMDKRPVVIGAGPAGLFAAYTLALNGYNPIILEQGKSIEDREKDVEEFINNRKLNVSSNIQFGEGGARNIFRWKTYYQY